MLPRVDNPNLDCLRGRDRHKLPVPIRDKRSEIWEMERHKIKKIRLGESLLTDTDPMLDESCYLRLSDAVRKKIDDLSIANKELVNDRVVVRNGLVVEFNPIIAVLLGCNTNVGVLGSDAQAKTALCYLLKYITKPPAELTHFLPLLNKARQTVENYPSQADDTGSEQRTAMHFLNRTANQLSSSVEVSSMMAAAALLGMPAETTSCSFHYVFVNAALKFVDNHPNLELVEEDEDICYQFGNVPSPTGEAEFDLSSDEEDPLAASNNFPIFDYDEENEPQVLNSSADYSLRRDEAAAAYVSDTVYTGPTGRIAVSQHVHYLHRGSDFTSYNLYEYAFIVSISPVNQITNRPIH